MIEEKAFQIKDELIFIRRHLHRTPETDFEEIKTSSFIRSKLDDYGIPYTTSAKTGTVALIKGKNSNKTVLLRADIDGLPIKDTLHEYHVRMRAYILRVPILFQICFRLL